MTCRKAFDRFERSLMSGRGQGHEPPRECVNQAALTQVPAKQSGPRKASIAQ